MDDGRETEGKQSSRGYMRISDATNKRIIAFAKLASLQLMKLSTHGSEKHYHFNKPRLKDIEQK